MNIDATQVGTAQNQQIANLEISLICVTTAGKSTVEGYFSSRWLLEEGIRRGTGFVFWVFGRETIRKG